MKTANFKSKSSAFTLLLVAPIIASILCLPLLKWAFDYPKSSRYVESHYTLSKIKSSISPMLLNLTTNIADAHYSESYYQSYYQGTYNLTIAGGNSSVTGNFSVTGAIGKGSGTFVIDHPLDPENKLLYHSFVESPDVKNIYDGVATLDANGEAIIKLPDYFEALNKDFRYQYSAFGEPAPNLYVKSEIKDNKFTLAGGTAGAKVSWQVTGIRHDPYILKNPIIPEVDKGPDALIDKGEYLFEGYMENEPIIEADLDLTSFLRQTLERVRNFFNRLSDVVKSVYRDR
jgi:hypothetical protein